MIPLFDKAIVSATFIGRAAQLDAFDHWLAQVSSGHSQVVCVAGEAGIGKSRLTAEVRAHAEAQGWQTVLGTCFEPDVVLPYAPLIDLLRTSLARQSLQEVRTRLGPWAPEFVKLLPELALLLPAFAVWVTAVVWPQRWPSLFSATRSIPSNRWSCQPLISPARSVREKKRCNSRVR